MPHNSLGRHHLRQKADVRKTQALELFKAGASYAEISRQLNCAPTTAVRWVKRELEKITAARTELAEQCFDAELTRLDGVIRQAWTMVVAACRACEGTGKGVEPVEGVSGLADVCLRCNGDGRMHRPEIRLRGLREYRQAIHQRSQMLGLYAPEKFALTDTEGRDVDFREEIRHLQGEDLTRELEAYLAGVNASAEEEEVHEG